jgi:hypothetical protein
MAGVILLRGSAEELCVWPFDHVLCVVFCRREPDEIKPDSLPAIRLLMREMEVAVREEDYEQAARLRDHPWMRLAEDINMHR